ncbi:hypothetical protein CAPTEDRAFT_189648 [Capitella teleta]|uniref:Uncharacterized protein n=1 Tax=Capitella teleta TaxID=283909 RepID=R7T5U8_CAPTE|nr:hypothetical protein CAPTEDRAFT_189648 [Capitella teleta]|eukprot:ELT88789.1 hypothetical protein CAPTEDRAFT_189648 [Capitella teleta]
MPKQRVRPQHTSPFLQQACSTGDLSRQRLTTLCELKLLEDQPWVILSLEHGGHALSMGCDQSKTVVSAEDVVTKNPGTELTIPVASVSAAATDQENGQLMQSGRLQVRELTEYQVDIIHSTWPLLSSDIAATGTSVFVDIFDNEPAIKKLFPYMQPNNNLVLPIEHLDKFPKFRPQRNQSN